MTDRLYANMRLRLLALTHDVVLYVVVVMVASVLGAAGFGFGVLADAAERIGILGFVVLYEPVLVWKTGGTWGHHECNIRVCDQDTGANIGFLRAVIRTVLKVVLGIFSFIFMFSTERHQTLHDLITNSSAQIRDPKLPFGPRQHYVAERVEAANVNLPSSRRRVTVILLYIALIGFALASFLAYLRIGTGIESCASPDQCPPGAQVMDAAVFVAWILLSGVAVRLGWKGHLPGCRRAVRDGDSS